MVPLSTQPRYYYPTYIQPQGSVVNPTNPNTHVDSVKIDIINPQAGGSSSTMPPKQPQVQPYPLYYPQMKMPAYQPVNFSPPVQTTQPLVPKDNLPKSNNLPASKLKDERAVPPKKEDGDKTETDHPKQASNVSSELVKRLDKGLNNTDEQTRVNTASELSLMCENDPEFAKDPRTTNLINRMLKDFNPNVRFFALTALDLGAAQNAETNRLLNKLKTSNDPLGDVALVNGILAKQNSQETKKKKVAFDPQSNVGTVAFKANPNVNFNGGNTIAPKQSLA